ncbi:MAG: arsenite methyltransferase [Chloroflexota bacterium]|nr:arsenite methyltransferase [Chloroflexota bacterium]
MRDEDKEEIRRMVRDSYGKIAQNHEPGCCYSSSCCGEQVSSTVGQSPTQLSSRMGYSEQELAKVPDGSNMGLGCGNPQAIAALRPGETVLDLGSGGGFDCFLAADQVGPTGKVIGIDMTSEMLSKARENAQKGGYTNVEFRLGEIEYLPVADSSVDVILSNCVINLSIDKSKVYKEAYRVLSPGGRLAISDVVAIAQLPPEYKNDSSLYCGCITGAITIPELEQILKEAGFQRICITPQEKSRELIKEWAPGKCIEDYVISATIEAVRWSAP